MDNLSCHKSPESMKAMRRLKYRWIYNVAYSPDWNPIETTFAKVKHRFRCLRGQVITGALHSITRASSTRRSSRYGKETW